MSVTRESFLQYIKENDDSVFNLYDWIKELRKIVEKISEIQKDTAYEEYINKIILEMKQDIGEALYLLITD